MLPVRLDHQQARLGTIRSDVEAVRLCREDDNVVAFVIGQQAEFVSSTPCPSWTK